MRRLWLLRHAKSSWDAPGVDDHARPLSERGRRAAAAIGAHCERAGIRPDVVACSSAVRARETLSSVLVGLGPAVRIRIDDGLYTFEARELLARIRSLQDDAGSVLLIGHNPAIGAVASRLAHGGDDLDRLRAKYPTAGLSTLELDVASWAEAGDGTAWLASFVTAADLT